VSAKWRDFMINEVKRLEQECADLRQQVEQANAKIVELVQHNSKLINTNYDHELRDANIKLHQQNEQLQADAAVMRNALEFLSDRKDIWKNPTWEAKFASEILNKSNSGKELLDVVRIAEKLYDTNDDSALFWQIYDELSNAVEIWRGRND
jgi:hypothetical protein